MSIRVETVERMSREWRKRVHRVRWRFLSLDEVSDKAMADSDGEVGRPLTWARWEQEFFSEVRTAWVRAHQEPGVKAGLRPAGVLDLVFAHELWRALEARARAESRPDLLERYDRGRLRLVDLPHGYPGQMPTSEDIRLRFP